MKCTKRSRLALLLALPLLAASVTACTRVEPGHVGIKVNLYGSEKGVSDYPLRTGMVWYNPLSTSVYEYPTYVQQATWTRTEKSDGDSITFNSDDGMVLNTDIGLAYHLDALKVPAFYVKFRTDNLDNITHVYLKNIIRDAFNAIASKMKVEDIYGPKKEELLSKVKEQVNREVNKDGIVLDQLTIVGSLRLPEPVMEALNAKIQATQNAIKAENELRQTEAEAKKAIAAADGQAKSILAVAKSQAEANNLLSRSITPTLVQYKAVERWNGAPPTYMGSGATPIPFINTK